MFIILYIQVFNSTIKIVDTSFYFVVLFREACGYSSVRNIYSSYFCRVFTVNFALFGLNSKTIIPVIKLKELKKATN